MQVSRQSRNTGDFARQAFALVFAAGAAGLVGCGAYAFASSLAGSSALGVAAAAVLGLPFFAPMFSMLSMPDARIRTTRKKTRALQKMLYRLY